MAYQIKRRKRIKEELRLIDENDNIVKSIAIDFDIDEKMKAFNKAQNDMIRAEQNMKAVDNDPTLARAEYGNAVIALFEVVFGEKGAGDIVDFYDNRYLEMTEDIFPFILDVFMPEIKKRAKERTESLKHKYAQSNAG